MKDEQQKSLEICSKADQLIQRVLEAKETELKNFIDDEAACPEARCLISALMARHFAIIEL
jgi:hypothetical protein